MMKPPPHRVLAAALLACAPLAAWADVATVGSLILSSISSLGISTAAAYALSAFAVALIVAGSAQKRRDQRRRLARARAAYNNSLEDRGVTLMQSVPPWRVVYGRCIVGGDIVAIFTSDKTGYRENGTTYAKPDALKHLVIVVAAHEIAAINEIYIEGIACGPLDGSGYVTSGEFYSGSAPDSRSVIVPASSYLDVPQPVVAVLRGYSTSGVGIDVIYTDVTPTLSLGNTRITNPSTNDIQVDYVIDPEPLASVRVHKHLGSSTQTVDAYLNSVVPSQWTANHRLRGLAYVVITLDLEEPRFQGGPPQMTFDVSGKLLYDPRTAVTAWSQNPALVVRDWLLSEWGYEVDTVDIDDAACIAAANACDVRQSAATQLHAATCTVDAAADTVTFASDMWFGVGDGVRFTTTGTLPGGLALATTYYAIPQTDRRTFKLATTRDNAFAGTARNITSAGTGTHTGTWYDYDAYTCCGAFTTADAREAVLEDLCDSMAGFAAYGATWSIHAGAWSSPVMHLGDDDLDG